SPSATVAAIEGGSALKIVGQVYRGSVIEIAVKANSPIRTFADLKGKKIGFTRPGSATHTLIKAMLAKGGLAQTDATLVPLGDIPSIGIALDEGSIDAGPPAGEVGLAERVDVKKDWRIIATGEDLIPGYFEIAIVVKESTLRDRPELVRSLFRALNKARDYIARNATSDELVQIATRFTNTKPEQVQYLKVVVQDYAGRADRFWGNYSLNMQGFQAIIDDMVETGALRQRPADVNKYLDLSFVR
ncbi:MAG TPA: ABC transporter substrate-binding protein, partial [Dehalococcoidia bacterium]|nr:ABC transporter substrate-binding protein [Dehalococcoidia bacterium]